MFRSCCEQKIPSREGVEASNDIYLSSAFAFFILRNYPKFHHKQASCHSSFSCTPLSSLPCFFVFLFVIFHSFGIMLTACTLRMLRREVSYHQTIFFKSFPRVPIHRLCINVSTVCVRCPNNYLPSNVCLDLLHARTHLVAHIRSAAWKWFLSKEW